MNMKSLEKDVAELKTQIADLALNRPRMKCLSTEYWDLDLMTLIDNPVKKNDLVLTIKTEGKESVVIHFSSSLREPLNALKEAFEKLKAAEKAKADESSGA